MKQTKHTLYIGQNNETKQLELDVIKDVLDGHVQGYTLRTGQGYWEGTIEPSATVEFIGEDTVTINRLAGVLKRKLKQDAILMTVEEIQTELI